MKNGSLAVYVKITASHHFDDLRLFHLFRIGSAPRFTSCPYGTEHLGRGVFSCICGFRMRKREGEAVCRTDGGSREEITYSDKKKLLNC